MQSVLEFTYFGGLSLLGWLLDDKRLGMGIFFRWADLA